MFFFPALSPSFFLRFLSCLPTFRVPPLKWYLQLQGGAPIVMFVGLLAPLTNLRYLPETQVTGVIRTNLAIPNWGTTL